MSDSLRYTVDDATASEIAAHLETCDEAFVAELRDRVDLNEYIDKIVTRATRTEAWSDGDLVGLVGLYANDETNHLAFVTHVSVSTTHQSTGVARRLVSEGIAIAVARGMLRIDLEVRSDNRRAKALYSSLGFSDVHDDGRTTIMSRSLESGVQR